MAQKPVLRGEVGCACVAREVIPMLSSPAGCSARVSAGEGAGARGPQPGVVAMRSSARVGVGEGAVACRSTARRRGCVFLGACPRGRRREGLKLYQLRAAWGATGQLNGI